MAIQQEFQREYQKLSAIPPSEHAVRSTGGLLGALAQKQSAQQLQGLESGTRRRGAEYQMETQRADIRSAKRDVGAALPLTAIGVGLKGVGAYEKLKAQKEQELHNRQVEDFWNAYGSVQTKHFDELMGILFPQQQPLMNTRL